MAQTKREIQALLAEAGGSPRHRFGQNFMIDQNLVRLVAEAGQISRDDLVIEVGPGTGTLTEELLERAGWVVAVEIDRDLAALLCRRFGALQAKEQVGEDAFADQQGPYPPPAPPSREGGRGRFTLIEGDALAGKHQLNPELLQVIRGYRGSGTVASDGMRTEAATRNSQLAARNLKLVANLPYNIASPLVVELLLAGVDLLAFTVQKEVAERLTAEAGSEEYGPLSVMVQLLSEVEVLRTLPPQAFWPAPKVESALVRVKKKGVRFTFNVGMTEVKSKPDPFIWREFGRFVQTLFAARRKTLRKALSQTDLDASVAERLGLDLQQRPETLTPEQFHHLFAAFRSASSGEGESPR